jgi:phage tail sheath protein FI
MGLAPDAFLFNLTVQDSAPGGATERFFNLTIVPSARRIDRVLENQSNLVRWDGEWATTKPAGLPLVKVAVDAQKALATALAANPQVPATIDAARTALANALNDLRSGGLKADAQLTAALAAKPPVPADIAAAETAVKTAEDAMHASDGVGLDDATYEGSKDNKTGLFALDKADLFNLLCIPPDGRANSGNEDTSSAVYQSALSYCHDRRAMLVVDPPAAWSADGNVNAAADAKKHLPDLGLTGENARNAALYFPRVRESDPLRDGQLDTFAPCGIVAGIMARTDTTRGVWKAPAGLDATLSGVQALDVNLNDGENGLLNPLGINCLRFFPVAGRVVWGSRTLRGADQLADEYKYVPVRRTALFLEESLYRGLQWVVFEPNDEPLWAQIRLNVGAFMQSLFRQGAFQGTTPRDAYFVKCDSETTTQTDINLGIVNIIVGFAPLKPAEFVVVKLQQMAGQIPT